MQIRIIIVGLVCIIAFYYQITRLLSVLLDDKYNIPKVVECTKLLDEWVYPEDGDTSRLLNTPPRELPEYVRRLTQDIYMCVYIQPDLSMYG